MANDKNNNMLVADDDPTTELETLSLQPQDAKAMDQLESEENTYDIEKKVDGDAKEVSRLQFDIETLRSKLQGLEAELQSREELTSDLNAQIAELHDKVSQTENLVKVRDGTIKSLETEIRDRDEQHGNATAMLEEQLETARKAIHEVPEPPQLDHDRLVRCHRRSDGVR